MSPITGPITFSGTLNFTFGVHTPISLPSWLGNAEINPDLADLDLTATINSQAITGSGSLTIAGNLETATVNTEYDVSSGAFKANGTVNVLGNTFTGDSQLTATNGDIVLYGTGHLSLPLKMMGLPDLLLAGGGLLLNLLPSDLSHSYLDLWGTFVGATLGVGVKFDGSFSILKAKPIVPVDPPASATYSLPAGTPWILLDAQWTNPTSNVPFQN